MLLVRVEERRGFSHFTGARSRDGKSDWHIEPHPTLEPAKEAQEERWGIEDPRIVWLEERGEYAITYVSFASEEASTGFVCEWSSGTFFLLTNHNIGDPEAVNNAK